MLEQVNDGNLLRLRKPLGPKTKGQQYRHHSEEMIWLIQQRQEKQYLAYALLYAIEIKK